MTGSGVGPMTVRNMPPALQKKFVFPDVEIMKEFERMNGYGMSKAMLHMYASVVAKEYPQYRCYSITPGYIQTKLTGGNGLPVEKGTVSIRHCLFHATKEQSGWYFGSDAKRSPIHATRDPGTPEFDGVYPF